MHTVAAYSALVLCIGAGVQCKCAWWGYSAGDSAGAYSVHTVWRRPGVAVGGGSGDGRSLVEASRAPPCQRLWESVGGTGRGGAVGRGGRVPSLCHSSPGEQQEPPLPSPPPHSVLSAVTAAPLCRRDALPQCAWSRAVTVLGLCWGHRDTGTRSGIRHLLGTGAREGDRNAPSGA